MMKYLTLIVAFFGLFTSCKRENPDNLFVEIEGVLINGCTGKPLANVEIWSNTNRFDTLYTDSSGRFFFEKSWPQRTGWLIYPQTQIDFIVVLRDSVGDMSNVYELAIPMGYTNLGTLSVREELEIPIVIDTNQSTCSNCKWEIHLKHTTPWTNTSSSVLFQISSPNAGYYRAKADIPMSINPITLEINSPLFICVVEIDSLGNRTTTFKEDITEKVKLCNPNDTVFFTL